MVKIASGGTQVELPKVGTYVARLYSIIHKGSELGKFGYQTQCELRFELPTTLAVFKEENGEQPHAVSIKWINVPSKYSDNSKFFKILKKLGWKEGDDIESVIGAPCQISVSHYESNNGKTYLQAKAEDIAQVLDGVEVPKQINDGRFFRVEADYDITRADQINEKTGEPKLDSNGDPMQFKKDMSAKNVSLINEDILMDWEQESFRKTIEWNALNSISEVKDGEALPF